MPRLDIWLVQKGIFSSRQIAKRAIKAGYVIVNGNFVKPSTIINGAESIIITDMARDVTLGYSKISQIYSQIGSELLQPGDLILDVGCSAGGFLSFLLEYNVNVIGIEISDEFIDNLEKLVSTNENLSIIFDNAFTINPLIITGYETLDLLIIDVTTNPSGSLQLLDRFTPLLKTTGHVLLALKIDPNSPLINTYSLNLTNLGYLLLKQITLDDTRKEVHLFARRGQ